VIVDQKGALFLWGTDGMILWKHMTGGANGGKIIAAVPWELSSLLLIVSANNSYHIQSASMSIVDGIFRFTLDDTCMAISADSHVLGLRCNPDGTFPIMNMNGSITLVKRK